MQEFLQANGIQLITFIGIALGWLFDSRRRAAELEKARSEAELGKGTAVEQMQKAYTQFVADRTAEYTEIATENRSLSDRLKELENRERENAKERGVLSGKIEAMTKQRDEDQKTIEKLQCKIDDYEKEIREYKALLDQYKLELSKYKQNAGANL